jgi:hypothetical protein
VCLLKFLLSSLFFLALLLGNKHFVPSNVCIFFPFPSLWINIFRYIIRNSNDITRDKAERQSLRLHIIFQTGDGGGKIFEQKLFTSIILSSLFPFLRFSSRLLATTFRYSIEGFSSHVASFTVAWILINHVARRHKKRKLVFSPLPHSPLFSAARKMEFPFSYGGIKYSEYSKLSQDDELHTFIDKERYFPSQSHSLTRLLASARETFPKGRDENINY